MALARNSLEPRCLEWTIERPPPGRYRESPIFSFQGHQCHFELSASAPFGFPEHFYSLVMKCNNGRWRECFASVQAKSGTHELPSPFVRCRLSSLKTEENLWVCYESTIMKANPNFCSQRIFSFLVFFHDSEESSLSLDIEKDYSVQTEEKSVQTFACPTSDPCLEKLSGDLSKLLNEETYPDIELKCGDFTVKAHKNVLCTRSQVFAAMLKSDMVEGRTGLVEIKDMDAKIFEMFIQYLYNGKLPELTVDTARHLYVAGDKYAVDRLTRRCADFLSDNLMLDNACELLSLADAHNDQDFRESAITYILDRKIHLQDQQWLPFCDRYPRLAVEVLNRGFKLQSLS